jgi:hypothetical protein
MIWRIIAIVILVASASAFPYILTILLGILFLMIFKNFIEIIPVFFLNDVLYGVPLPHFLGFQFSMTLFAAVLFMISVLFKKYIFEGSFIRS